MVPKLMFYDHFLPFNLYGAIRELTAREIVGLATFHYTWKVPM